MMNTIEIYRRLIEVNARAIHSAVLENEVLFERARFAGMMSILLEQDGDVQFTDEDANKLKAAVDQIEAEIEKNKNWIVSSELTDAVDGLKADLPDVSEIATLAATGKTEQLQQKVQDLTSRLNRMVLSLSSTQNVMVSLGKNLKPIFDKLEDADMEKKISSLAEESKSGGGKITAGEEQLSFPTTDDLKSAIEKTFTPSDGVKSAIQSGVQAGKDESGGFFSKVVGFFKDLFSKPAPPGQDDKLKSALVTNVMSMTPAQLLVAASEAAAASESLEGPAQGGAEAGAEASAGAAAAAGEAEAAAAEKAIARGKWTVDAAADPEAFAARINRRAGKRVLESRTTERWAQLAGIREDRR
jgi:hypothetical protein